MLSIRTTWGLSLMASQAKILYRRRWTNSKYSMLWQPSASQQSHGVQLFTISCESCFKDSICTHALLLALLCYSTLKIPAQYHWVSVQASQWGSREAAQQCNAGTLMTLLNKTRRQPGQVMQVALCGYNADLGMQTSGTMWLGTCYDYPGIHLEGRLAFLITRPKSL